MGAEASKRFRELISGKAPKLCNRCTDARAFGEYRYDCKGCKTLVTRSFDEVRDLLAKAFCRTCMLAFYGRYDAKNPALIDVLAARAAKQKKRRRARYLDSEAQRLLLEEGRWVCGPVRRLSRANLRRSEILNPHSHKLGRSGVAGAYQLDHIVPVSVCWGTEYLKELSSPPTSRSFPGS
jgi:hypothetical protein